MSLFTSPTGKTFTSIIWGLGIAALFYLACKEGGCLVLKAPENFNGTYQFGDDCYQFQPYPVTCNNKEGFTTSPESLANCDSYRYHGLNSFEFPCDSDLQPTIPKLTGFDAPITFDRVSNCKNCSNFDHPHCLWYQHRKAKNCGDPRHFRSAECYKHHPMDSIFRAPAQQVYFN